LRHVESLRLLGGGQGRARLRVPGDLQSEFVGARDTDELLQARGLRLPAESADPAIRGAADPAPDVGGLALSRRNQYLRRNGVDSTRAEQGRSIPFGAAELEAIHRPGAGS